MRIWISGSPRLDLVGFHRHHLSQLQRFVQHGDDFVFDDTDTGAMMHFQRWCAQIRLPVKRLKMAYCGMYARLNINKCDAIWKGSYVARERWLFDNSEAEYNLFNPIPRRTQCSTPALLVS